MGGFSLILPG